MRAIETLDQPLSCITALVHTTEKLLAPVVWRASDQNFSDHVLAVGDTHPFFSGCSTRNDK